MLATVLYNQDACYVPRTRINSRLSIHIRSIISRHRKSEEVPFVRAVQDSLLLSTRACSSLLVLQRQAARTERGKINDLFACLPQPRSLFVARGCDMGLPTQ